MACLQMTKNKGLLGRRRPLLIAALALAISSLCLDLSDFGCTEMSSSRRRFARRTLAGVKATVLGACGAGSGSRCTDSSLPGMTGPLSRPLSELRGCDHAQGFVGFPGHTPGGGIWNDIFHDYSQDPHFAVHVVRETQTLALKRRTIYEARVYGDILCTGAVSVVSLAFVLDDDQIEVASGCWWRSQATALMFRTADPKTALAAILDGYCVGLLDASPDDKIGTWVVPAQ